MTYAVLSRVPRRRGPRPRAGDRDGPRSCAARPSVVAGRGARRRGAPPAHGGVRRPDDRAPGFMTYGPETTSGLQHRSGAGRGLRLSRGRASLLLPAVWLLSRAGGADDDDDRAGAVRQLLLASRPLSWINTAFPFAAAYLLTHRPGRSGLVVGHAVLPHPVQPGDVRDQRCLRLRVGPTQSPQGRRGGRAPRPLRCIGARSSPRRSRPSRSSSAWWSSGSPLSWLVLAVSVFAVVAYSVRGLRFKEMPFLDSRDLEHPFRQSRACTGSCSRVRCSRPRSWRFCSRSSSGGSAATPSGPCRMWCPTVRRGIASIATALGAAAHAYVSPSAPGRSPGVAMLVHSLARPARRACSPCRTSRRRPVLVGFGRGVRERANRGWRRFLWINYACGFVVTMLLIAFAVATR